jgi:hypothetical protein
VVVDEVEVPMRTTSGGGGRPGRMVLNFELDHAVPVSPLADVVHRKEDDGVDE